MNERIKQLAEQAGITLSQKDFSYYWVESAEDIGKFAELIVRECAIIAFEEWQHNSTSGESVILKHFGVEE
jgi:hypothetical protein